MCTTLLLLPCGLMRWVATLEMSGFSSLHRLTTLGDQCRDMAWHLALRVLRSQLRECASGCGSFPCCSPIQQRAIHSTMFATGSRPSQDTRMARAVQAQRPLIAPWSTVGVRLHRVGFAQIPCRARLFTRGDQRQGRRVFFCGRQGFIDADYILCQPF